MFFSVELTIGQGQLRSSKNMQQVVGVMAVGTVPDTAGVERPAAEIYLYLSTLCYWGLGLCRRQG